MQQGQPGAAGEQGPAGPKVCSSLTWSCSMKGLDSELLEGWEGKGGLDPRRDVRMAMVIGFRHLWAWLVLFGLQSLEHPDRQP